MARRHGGGRPQLKLEGSRFGRLVVLAQALRPATCYLAGTYWLVRCDCGVERVVYGRSLVHGHTRSCGCWRRERSAELAARRRCTAA